MDHRGSHRGGKCQHAEDLHAERTAGVRLKLVRRPFRNGQFSLRHPVAWQRHHVSPGRFSLLDRLSQDRCGLQGTRRRRMRQIGVAQDIGRFLGGSTGIDQGLQRQPQRRLIGGLSDVHVQFVYQQWQQLAGTQA